MPQPEPAVLRQVHQRILGTIERNTGGNAVAVKDSVNAPSKWVLAVDFGTSSTAAAIGRDGGAELVGVDGGLPRMLSNVFLDESNGNLLLGELAEQSSRLRGALNGHRRSSSASSTCCWAIGV